MCTKVVAIHSRDELTKCILFIADGEFVLQYLNKEFIFLDLILDPSFNHFLRFNICNNDKFLCCNECL